MFCKKKYLGTQNGLLREKTRIFVTHGLTFLKHCDQIIVIKGTQIIYFFYYSF